MSEQLDYNELLAQVKALAEDPYHDWSPAELQALGKKMQTVLETFRVPMTAYGWTYDVDGELHGLTAGDQGYEPSGLFLDHFTKKYLDKLEAQAKLAERLDKEFDRLIAYFPSDPFTDEVVDLVINTIELEKKRTELERQRAEKNLEALDRVLDTIAALMLLLTNEKDIVSAMRHLTPDTPDIVALAERVLQRKL